MSIFNLRAALGDELERAFAVADEERQLIEPTEEEKRNGWTAETLSNYVAEREAGRSLMIDGASLHSRVAARPRSRVKYDPLRWRR